MNKSTDLKVAHETLAAEQTPARAGELPETRRAFKVKTKVKAGISRICRDP